MPGVFPLCRTTASTRRHVRLDSINHKQRGGRGTVVLFLLRNTCPRLRTESTTYNNKYHKTESGGVFRAIRALRLLLGQAVPALGGARVGGLGAQCIIRYIVARYGVVCFWVFGLGHFPFSPRGALYYFQPRLRVYPVMLLIVYLPSCSYLPMYQHLLLQGDTRKRKGGGGVGQTLIYYWNQIKTRITQPLRLHAHIRSRNRLST